MYRVPTLHISNFSSVRKTNIMTRYLQTKKLFIPFLVTVLIGGIVPSLALVASAFSGPSQQPPNGDPVFWRTNGTSLYFNSGNAGVGITSPSYKLHAQGDIYTSGSVRASGGICIGATCKTSVPSSVPSGIVLFFNLASCPTGWSEYISARGRYLVGKPSGGTLNGSVGTALSNKENRPVGQHTHTINDPGHDHFVFYNPNNAPGFGGTDFDLGSYMGFPNPVTTPSADTGVTINNSGSVAGTNAPYIQLLACEKN